MNKTLKAIALVVAMLTAGISPAFAEPGTDLIDAVKAGETAKAEQALAAGANPDAQDALGHTPLMWAIATNNVTMVRALLERGASPYIGTKYGRRAIDMARSYNNPAVLALFGEQAEAPIAVVPALRPVATTSSRPPVSSEAAGRSESETPQQLTLLTATDQQVTFRFPAGPEQTIDVPSARNPLLAGGLSAAVPGLGEISNGDALLGTTVIVGSVALFFLEAYSTPSAQPIYGFGRIAVNVGSAALAAWRAQGLNEKRSELLLLQDPNLPLDQQHQVIRKHK